MAKKLSKNAMSLTADKTSVSIDLSDKLDTMTLQKNKQLDSLSAGDKSEIVDKVNVNKFSENPDVSSANDPDCIEYSKCAVHDVAFSKGPGRGEATSCVERESSFWKSATDEGPMREKRAVFSLSPDGEEETMTAAHAESLCKTISKEVTEKDYATVGGGAIGGKTPPLEATIGGEEDDAVDYCRDVISTVDFLHQHFASLLAKYFIPIGKYLLECTTSDDVNIALLACSYWSRHPRSSNLWCQIKDIPCLVAAMIKHMTYETSLADHLRTMDPSPSRSATIVAPDEAIIKLADLRNIAALGLENIFRSCGESAVSAIRPHLVRQLTSKTGGPKSCGNDADDWCSYEVMILALSALTKALGTPEILADLYPTLVACVLRCYNDPEPLVRSVACFTMPMLLDYDLASFGVKDLMKCVVRGTLEQLHDDCAEVRYVAMRSLATLLAFAPVDMVPYIGRIVDGLEMIDKKSIGDCRCYYYECISLVFGRAAASLTAKDVDRLVRPLVQQWSRLELLESVAEKSFTVPTASSNVNNSDADVDIVTLCQSLAMIVQHAGQRFTPYAHGLFSRATYVVRQVLAVKDDDALSQDVVISHLVGCLDLMSVAFEILGKEAVEFVASFGMWIIVKEVLERKAYHTVVHQSALALLGHMCRYYEYGEEKGEGKENASASSVAAAEASAWPEVKEMRPAYFLDIVAEHMKSDSCEVRCNSMWSLVFITRDPLANKNLLLSLVEDLVVTMKDTEGEAAAVINAAWALTSICAVHRQQTVAVLLSVDVFRHLCGVLQTRFPRHLEKVEIFQNLCVILGSLVDRIQPALLWVPFLLAVLTVMEDEEEGLHRSIGDLLRSVRKALGPALWVRVLHEVGQENSVALKKKYKLQ